MQKNRIKAIWMLLAAAIVLIGFSAKMTFADTYYTISVEYQFSDGTHAYDPYKAVYASGSDIDVQITNPVIPGYKPVSSLDEGAEEVLKTTIQFQDLAKDQTIVVYYVPAEVNYRVRYYFQNIENDLYTENLSLPPEYTDQSGVTGTYPAQNWKQSNLKASQPCSMNRMSLQRMVPPYSRSIMTETMSS